MTRISKLMSRVGWNQMEVARRTDRDGSYINKMVSGQVSTPFWIIEWLEQAARAIERLPPPKPTRRITKKGE